MLNRNISEPQDLSLNDEDVQLDVIIKEYMIGRFLGSFNKYMFPQDHFSREEREAWVTSCLRNRDVFLSLMPKNAVVAEIGVAGGGFAQKILSKTKPRMLYLVDPWEWGTQWHLYSTTESRKKAEGIFRKVTDPIIERESPGTSGGRGFGGKRGWFTPAGSDIDSYVAGGP
jgi:hypothetical protein